ncbi:hypothetical protein BH10BAC6_BH10BAC6_14910 [soil metagenome]
MKRIVLLMFLAASTVWAQPYPDSKGRDFWITFLPNFHNNPNQLQTDPLRQREHQIYLEIGAERPASGTITLRDRFGSSRVVNFAITDPRQIFEFKTYYEPYELLGFNNGGVIDINGGQDEIVAKQSVHIVSTDDITVYALNQAELTSEAFLVLPTDALAEDYVVMAYTSDAKLSGFGALATSTTPSQFAIVATEDSTTVEVLPTAPTLINKTMYSMLFTLQRGESYLIQADPATSRFADLTGSTVRASKPVAVFGGQQRATLPIQQADLLSSRDCVIEQMNPVRTWGKRAFLAPFALPSDEIGIGNDLFRVVAGFDSTKVVVDGDTVASLSKGQHYEGALTQPTVVRTTRPSLIAAFKKSSSPSGSANQPNNFGDPFMMLIPPSEQFMDSYRFVNVQSYSFSGSVDNPQLDDSVYKEQWLNIVIPTPRVGSVVLDGAPVNPARFRVFPDPEYSYAQIAMGGGVHSISADTNFGIYVYGYGKANSYGYVGGMAFRPLDVTPPQFGGAPSCFDLNGVVSDSILGDTRLKLVRLVPRTDSNVVLTFQNAVFPASSVRFVMSLINPYNDGAAVIEAEDFAEQRSQTSVQLAGFTIGLREVGSQNIIPGKSWVTPVGRGRCDTVTIVNYGAYPHTIDTISFGVHSISVVGGTMPYRLNPGDSLRLAYCATYTIPGLNDDTLKIGDKCLVRPIQHIAVDVRLDNTPPKITADVDACSTLVNVSITETEQSDFGLDTIAIAYNLLQNCTLVVTDSTASRFRFAITILDPFADAIWGVFAVDSAGNRSIRLDTIPGFTLSIASSGGGGSSVNYGEVDLGTMDCKNISIENTGIFSITIPTVIIRGNIRYSIPAHQLPLTLAPKTSAVLIVCFEPVRVDLEPVRDTIVFSKGCAEKELALEGSGKAVGYDGISRCNMPVGVSVIGIPSAPPLLASPLPASNSVTIVLSQPTEACTVRIIDAVGADAATFTWKGMATQALILDVASLPDGIYTCVVRSAHLVQSGRVLVKH